MTKIQQDPALVAPEAFLAERWGSVAPELIRQARLQARLLALLSGNRPLTAPEAKRAWKHLGEALELLQGRIPEKYELPLRELFQGLGSMKHKGGRSRKDRALFAREMLRWAVDGLPLEIREAAATSTKRLPPSLNARDLLALACVAGVERRPAKLDALAEWEQAAPREWRRLHEIYLRKAAKVLR